MVAGTQIEEARSTVAFWRNPRRWFAEQNLGNSFWKFFLVALCFDAGFSIYVFLFNLYLFDLHFNERMIGWIGGTMTAGSVAGLLPAGWFGKKIGTKPLILCAVIGAPIVSIARACWTQLPAQFVLAFVTGSVLCCWGAGFLPVVASVTTEKSRPAGFSLIFSTGIAVSAFGGVVCGYLQQWMNYVGLHWQAAEVKRLILVCACLVAFLGVIPLATLRIPKPESKDAEVGAVRWEWLQHLGAQSFLVKFLPVMALWSGVLAAFNPFANIYLERQLHVPMTRIGVIFSITLTAQFVLGLLAPVVFRAIGLVRGVVLMEAMVALEFALLAVAGQAQWAIGAYLVVAGMQWMNSPGLYSLLVNRTPESDLSMASATLMFCNALVGAGITALTGTLLTRFGYRPVFVGIAIAAAVVALLLRITLGRDNTATSATAVADAKAVL
ncbi:MAG TPA: MFS transporter [Acidobacteriaceae bacterium]|nr:MFS transporter [Acidobacteriaceae bacterium]